MSRIYFHAEDGEAELHGAERAHMGVLVGDLLAATFRCTVELDVASSPSPLRKVINEGWWTRDFQKSFPRACSGIMGGLTFQVNGKAHDAWVVGLNTSLAIGNDVLKLFARLHGQCEIHAYVLGPNRAWLAGIIDRGLALGLCREGMGWDAIAGLLRESATGPVVTSYSVCAQFPNAEVAEWQDENDGDDWHELSDERRWELSSAQLFKDKLLELTPRNWDTYVFGDGVNSFHVLEAAANAT